MAYTALEIAETSGGPWLPMFNWDGNLGGVEDSSIAAYGRDVGGEEEMEFIPAPPASGLHEDLISPPPATPNPPFKYTGIAIDISKIVPGGVHYAYIRLSSPPSAISNNTLDAIYRLN